MNMLAVNICMHYVEYKPRSETVGSYNLYVCSTLVDTSFPKYINLYAQQSLENPTYSTSLSIFGIISVFHFSHSGECKMGSHDFICISLRIHDMKHLLMSIGPMNIFFANHLLNGPTHFSIVLSAITLFLALHIV